MSNIPEEQRNRAEEAPSIFKPAYLEIGATALVPCGVGAPVVSFEKGACLGGLPSAVQVALEAALELRSAADFVAPVLALLSERLLLLPLYRPVRLQCH